MRLEIVAAAVSAALAGVATVRRAAIKRAEHRCQRCRQIRGRLDVQHLTYERLGCEDYTSDLEVLCRACHSKTHGIPE